MSAAPRPFRPDAELLLPATLLSRYLFFLGRRPVSAANEHYRASRVAALKSLGDEFDDPRVCAPLRALTPANLFRVAPQLQTVLQPQLASHTPRDLAATSLAPAPHFWKDTHRLLVVYGPAIGIGDEIVTSTIPGALRRLVPSVTVLSAYQGLWDRVAPEEHVEHYRDLRTLARHLRGEEYDAIFYVDFEPPGLVTAMAHQPGVKTFAELSLGTRMLTVLDNKNRRLHQMPPVAPYHENFYRALKRMMDWLGMDVGGSPNACRNGDALVVASPFTSKEEPSEAFWCEVLAPMMPRGARLVLDTGPNSATRAFAMALRDALRGRDVRCELAASGRAAPLGEMLDIVRDAKVVVTADSYLAHAGPALGAKTLVIARKGLEPWRVPSAASYYFQSNTPPGAIGEAMHALLEESQRSPADRIESRQLRDAAADVDFLAPAGPLLDAWQRCLHAHHAVVAALPDWPPVYEPLFLDERYGSLMPRAPHAEGMAEDDLRAHLANRFAECAGSNLWKFVRGTV